MREEKKRKRYTLFAVFVLIVALVGYMAAKYIQTSRSGAGQALPEDFYFTVDLLGDETMHNSDAQQGAGDTYAFPEVQSGQWSLYGGGEHNISIQVRNYSDKLRITQQSITYEYKVEVSKPTGEEVAESKVALTNDATSTILTGKQESQNTLQLTIPAYTAQAYDEGTTVTVTITSTKPYQKEIKLKFVLFSTDIGLWYQIKDSVGSPYAELILMTNATTNATENSTDLSSTICPTLTWIEGLSIDNTNNLTFTYENGTFTQKSITNTDGKYSMTISKELKQGESESIYFFKTDTSKDYSKEISVVVPANQIYTISVG